MKCRCHYCGKEIEKFTGHVNRAIKLGLNVYCNRICSGLGRRHNKTEEELKIEKSWYDAFIRESDKERLKKQRHEYFVKDYAANPEKYREIRRKKQKAHNEYCRQQWYRQWKKEYDQKHVARKHYGGFGEAAIALRQLRGIVDKRKAKSDQDNLNKSKKRRKYGKTYSKKPQERALAINQLS